ncbi:uncharacterized protein LOC129754419 [Uranotaenia lowii]|uniref:uncharacterized protein LOC129754419 n=1 Tax=Uranotaenia lowii TaxID=190385 RepID=UPI002479B8BC|nr:uncharacterized protein LOC129754419 [Uranotaenia lowii]
MSHSQQKVTIVKNSSSSGSSFSQISEIITINGSERSSSRVTVIEESNGHPRTMTKMESFRSQGGMSTTSNKEAFFEESFKKFSGRSFRTDEKSLESGISRMAIAPEIPKTEIRSPEPSKATQRTAEPLEPSAFRDAVLEAHNRLRAKHSAPPLSRDPALDRYAQEWANNLAARNCALQHRSNGKYGENLYAAYGKTNLSGEDAVQSWYDEIKFYTFGQASPGNFSQVGHFTQVVWKGSTKLGVGMATKGSNVVVVCNYDPPGNFTGRYRENVTKN